MKISSLQENLKKGLYIVSHVAGKNVNLPILNNILIEAKDGNIKLITTNLELGVLSNIRGKVEKEGSFTVDSKTILDYVTLHPNKKINLEKKENSLFVDSDNYKTKILGMPAEEFPLIPIIERKNFYSAKIDDLKQVLSQVVFAVSTSETRMELSGVLFDFKPESLTLAATDSYRLAEKKIKIKSNNNSQENLNKKIIVPARTVQELIRILSVKQEDDDFEDGGEIKIYLSENQILFIIGATEVISRLIEGQYPDYQQIIPTNNKTEVLMNKNELIRAVKASSIFSKTGINDINLDFPTKQNKVVISSVSGQTGENITELEANTKGEDNGVVINYRYLLDGLNNIDSENIKIEIIDSNTPCVLRPEKDDNYLYIIMPIKQ